MASAHVYAVLLHQPMWYGVPLKIVLWNFMGTLGCLMIVLLIFSSLVFKILGGVVVILLAIGVHVAFKRSGQTDPDLLEVVLRFVMYPRYLGPR